jgi:hypothetical protein
MSCSESNDVERLSLEDVMSSDVYLPEAKAAIVNQLWSYMKDGSTREAKEVAFRLRRPAATSSSSSSCRGEPSKEATHLIVPFNPQTAKPGLEQAMLQLEPTLAGWIRAMHPDLHARSSTAASGGIVADMTDSLPDSTGSSGDRSSSVIEGAEEGCSTRLMLDQQLHGALRVG